MDPADEQSAVNIKSSVEVKVMEQGKANNTIILDCTQITATINKT